MTKTSTAFLRIQFEAELFLQRGKDLLSRP
jgi:hypothetical protein